MLDIQTAPEAAHKIIEILAQAKDSIADSYMTIGRALSLMSDKSLYKSVGFKTFDEFIADQGFSRSTAYNCIRVYEHFGEFNVKGIAQDRLVKLLPLEIPEEAKEEWIEKARLLRAEDFGNEVAEARGKTPTDKCDHQEVEVMYKCKCCHKWIKG